MSSEQETEQRVDDGKPHMLDRDPNGLNDSVQVGLQAYNFVHKGKTCKKFMDKRKMS